MIDEFSYRLLVAIYVSAREDFIRGPTKKDGKPPRRYRNEILWDIRDNDILPYKPDVFAGCWIAQALESKLMEQKSSQLEKRISSYVKEKKEHESRKKQEENDEQREGFELY